MYRHLILQSEKMNIFGFFPGLIISLQLLRGDMEQIRRENPIIFNRGVSVTRKLGFPDVIMPGKHSSSNLNTLVIFFSYSSRQAPLGWVLCLKKIKNRRVALFISNCQSQVQGVMLKRFNSTNAVVIAGVKFTSIAGDLERTLRYSPTSLCACGYPSCMLSIEVFLLKCTELLLPNNSNPGRSFCFTTLMSRVGEIRLYHEAADLA